MAAYPSRRGNCPFVLLRVGLDTSLSTEVFLEQQEWNGMKYTKFMPEIQFPYRQQVEVFNFF